jgi:hypothetical protein
MEIKKTNTIKSSIKTHDHPYLKGCMGDLIMRSTRLTDLNALGRYS